MSLPILFFYGFAFAGLVHSVIYSILAIKGKRMDELILTLFLFIQSLIILEYVFFWTGLRLRYPQLNNISLTLLFLFGPLLFIYIDFVFSENKKTGKYFYHFIPAILVFIFMLPYYLSAADLKLHDYKMIKYFILDLRYVTLLTMVHLAFYFILILLKLIREKRVGHISNWLLLLTGLFGFYIVCYISYFIMVRQPWFTLTTDYFVSTGMCGSIVAIIYLGYGKKKILEGWPVGESIKPDNIYFSYNEIPPGKKPEKKKEQSPIYKFPARSVEWQEKGRPANLAVVIEKTDPGPVEDIISVKYKNSGLTTEAGHELAAKMKQLMLTEKLYRECDLKLETLASKLGVAKHYLSQVINQHYQVNFFEYINLLRIEDAKQILISTDKKTMNIVEVAYTVGYNTKNTFNSAFRRIVGVTPTEYRSQNQIRLN